MLFLLDGVVVCSGVNSIFNLDAAGVRLLLLLALYLADVVFPVADVVGRVGSFYDIFLVGGWSILKLILDGEALHRFLLQPHVL